MWERFNSEARIIIGESNEIARGFSAERIAPEHLAIACFRDPGYVGSKIIAEIGISPTNLAERISEELRRLRFVRINEDTRDARLPQTNGSRFLVEKWLEYSMRLHHNYMGSEHFPFALAISNYESRNFQDGGIVGQILRKLTLEPKIMDALTVSYMFRQSEPVYGIVKSSLVALARVG